MKISFNKKLLAGFIINLLIVFASVGIFTLRFNTQNTLLSNIVLNWIEFSLFCLSAILLAIVYYIMQQQKKARDIAQFQLSENKKLFQEFIDKSPSGIFIKKLNGEYLLINKKFRTLYQAENDDLILGKVDQDFLQQNLAETHRNSDYEVVKAGREMQIEENIEQNDEVYTYLIVKFPLYDAAGRIYAIGGIATDITERKKIENSLLAGNKFFSMSLDILIIGSMEKFIKVNPVMIKTLGYSEEELLNGTFFTYLLPDDHEISHKELEKLQTGALTIQFENRWIAKDGAIKWISWSVSPDIASGLLYAVGRDVTAQKEIEKSLAIAEQFFNLSFEILLVIEDNNFVRVNPAFGNILGYSQNEIINKSYKPLIHADDFNATMDAITKLKEGLPVANHRTRVLAKNGNYKWLDWNGTFDIRTRVMYAVARDVSLLIEKEESLKIANNFFEISFDAFAVSEGEKIIKINPAFTEISGYDQKELENMSFLDLVHPDYLEIMRERLAKRAKREELDAKVTIPLLCKDGSYKWAELMSSTDLTTGRAYSVLRDVTHRKLDEEKLSIINHKLKDEEEQIQTIFEHAPDPVIVIDSESKVIRWNPRAESVFGWMADEVIGHPIYEKIVPLRYVESHKKGMTNFLQTGEGPLLNTTTEIEAVNKQGIEFPIALSISPLKMDGKDFFIGFVRDITTAKKAVDDLQKNEEKLKLILENIGEGVIVADSHKKVIMVNDVVNEIFETEEDDKISPDLAKHFELYFPDEKTIFPSQDLPMERALKGEVTDDLDLVLVNTATKRKRRVLISGRPLLDKNNKIIVAVVTIKDISKYKELEAELKQTEQKYRQLIGFRKTD